MKEFKSDYIGFTYNGIHSSELGIVRISSGSRFEENLLPTMQDKTVQVPGGDGTYYFGSYYTQKPLNIPFAFDNLSEEQFERLRVHFGDKRIHDLVFDERPYKAYRAKVTGTATIKYIPFNEGEGRERVYKGEGSIQFTCYDPYAICRKKYLDEYFYFVEADFDQEETVYVIKDNEYVIYDKSMGFDQDLIYYKKSFYGNKNEWAAASGLLESKGEYDTLRQDNEKWIIDLYNPGAKESDCMITLKTGEGVGYYLSLDNGDGITLEWDEGIKKTLLLDSKRNLLLDANTGEIYNEYVVEGDFFKIPLGQSKLTVKKLGADSMNDDDVMVEYDYYYL